MDGPLGQFKLGRAGPVDIKGMEGIIHKGEMVVSHEADLWIGGNVIGQEDVSGHAGARAWNKMYQHISQNYNILNIHLWQVNPASTT